MGIGYIVSIDTPTEFANTFIMVCERKREVQIDSKILRNFYLKFFSVLLRYN